MKYYIHPAFWKFRPDINVYRAPRGKHMRQNLANGRMVNARVWTDYPLNKNDLIQGKAYDEPRVEAPFRKVELIGWDHNKYCLIKYEESIFEIKLGYCFANKLNRYWWHNSKQDNVYKQRHKFPDISREQLPSYLNGKMYVFLTYDDIKDFIVTKEQAEKDLIEIENKLAKRYGIKDNIREELIKLCKSGEMIEDDLVQDWHGTKAFFDICSE